MIFSGEAIEITLLRGVIQLRCTRKTDGINKATNTNQSAAVSGDEQASIIPIHVAEVLVNQFISHKNAA